jgi:hypothetical protein
MHGSSLEVRRREGSDSATRGAAEVLRLERCWQNEFKCGEGLCKVVFSVLPVGAGLIAPRSTDF